MEPQNTNPRQDIIDKINESKNILVTVRTNPSVDDLAACLGLTLWLNKAERHATAVFSGEVPSTLEFLQPAETLEKNTDSLRDFIISLDKSKADKLRYKVEENVVKIFITPYRTSLSADDLEYSQGDFNVDMVIALGVQSQADLDAAITAHGRILHDATVATITTGSGPSELGSMSWHDDQASSLSELVAELGSSFNQAALDGQIATSLLTGIVSETARFSNEKTTPQTMSVSAQLMAAGANQQLVASKLEEPAPQPEPAETPAEEPENNDGSLQIAHEENPEELAAQPENTEGDDFSLPTPAETPETPEEQPVEAAPGEPAPQIEEGSSYDYQEPELGGTLTANVVPEDEVTETSVDPLSNDSLAEAKPEEPLLSHEGPAADTTQPAEPAEVAEQPVPAEPFDPNAMQPAPPSWMPPQPWLDTPVDPAAEITEAPEAEAAAPEAPTLPAPEAPAAPNEAEAPAEPASETPAAPVEAPAEPEPAAEAPVTQEPAVQAAPIETLDLPVPVAGDPSARETLADIEQAVNSSHLEAAQPQQPVYDQPLPPIEALNALPIDLNESVPEGAAQDTPAEPVVPVEAPVENLTAFDPNAFNVMNDPEVAPRVTPDTDKPSPEEQLAIQTAHLFQAQPAPSDVIAPAEPTSEEMTGPVDQSATLPLPGSLTLPPANPVPPTSASNDPTAPPPVPPPLPFTH